MSETQKWWQKALAELQQHMTDDPLYASGQADELIYWASIKFVEQASVIFAKHAPKLVNGTTVNIALSIFHEDDSRDEWSRMQSVLNWFAQTSTRYTPKQEDMQRLIAANRKLHKTLTSMPNELRQELAEALKPFEEKSNG